MNILIGRLRIELEKVKEGDKKLLPKGRQAEDFSPQVQDKKVAELEQRLLQATQHAIRARDVAEAEVQTRNDSEALREAEQNWGEMSALWDEVWGWTKEVLSEARELDNRGVVLGKLRQLDLRSPRAVIEALLRYGYLDDQEANLIGEMNSIFNSYKTGRRAVDAGALRSFKRLYGKLHA